jgi:HPt (histidine-containing phosphotransfer) domain-containing protein
MKYNIDLNKLADKFDFEIDEVEMIVETFLKTSKKNLDDIQKAIENDDKKKLSQAAHSLKGSSSTLQLTEIAELAKEIELNAKNNENIDYQNQYKQLKELINNIKEK